MITIGLEIHGDVALVYRRDKGQVAVDEIALDDLGPHLRAVYATQDGTDAEPSARGSSESRPHLADALFSAAQNAVPKVLSSFDRLQTYRQRGFRARL